MGTLSSIRSFAQSATHRIIEARRHRRTLRALDSLDQHILKDIGWARNEYDHAAARRRGR